jgi:hypothetical protein
MHNFSRSNGNGRLKNRAIEDEGVELTVFAARVGVGRKIAEEGIVQFAAGEAGIENFGVNASGNGTEVLLVKELDQFTSVAFPNGEERGHTDAGEIVLAVGAEVFKKDIAEGDFADTLVAEEAESFFHARFVDGIDALRRDEDFVERQAERLRLPPEKFAANAVHSDAVVAFGHRGEKGDDSKLLLLEHRVQRHSAVFATAPAEEDGFG